MPIILSDDQFKQTCDAVKYQPGYLMWKSTNLTYLASNDYSSQILGFTKADEFIETTDFDLRCKAYEYADMIRAYTNEIFARNVDRTWLQMFHFKHGLTLMFVTGTMIQNQQEQPRAFIIAGQDITHQPVLNSSLLIHPSLQDKIVKKESFLFELCDQYHQFPLGKKQSQCLFYFLRGYVAKQIAGKMNISVRTVEAHLARIKSLLDCNNRAQLYEKAIALGLLNILIK